MNIETKFNIGDMAWYHNKVCAIPFIVKEIQSLTMDREKEKCATGIVYRCHTHIQGRDASFDESELFITKEEAEQNRNEKKQNKLKEINE